jgi:hypothetical protein
MAPGWYISMTYTREGNDSRNKEMKIPTPQ